MNIGNKGLRRSRFGEKAVSFFIIFINVPYVHVHVDNKILEES